MYDENDNGKFDEDEKKNIINALVIYLQEYHYLTNIEYIHKDKAFSPNFIKKITPFFSNLEFEKGKMYYSFKFYTDFVLTKDHKLYFEVYDKGANFNFKLKDLVIKNYSDIKKINIDDTYAHIYFYNKEIKKQEEQKQIKEKPQSLFKIPAKEQKKEPINEIKKELNEIQEKPKKEQLESNNEEEDSILTWLGKKLNEIKIALEANLIEIKESNSILAYTWLLFFSFLYGIIHAAGPGHGKSLVASYFLNQDKSYLKAFNISLLIGVVHTFSAFLLTFIIYNFLGLVLNETLLDIESTATKISAVIIILIALYLIYKKLPKNKSDMAFKVAQNQSFVTTQKFTHTNSLSCGCSACKTTSTDLGVILSAGMIPCPGTVTIFIFTMSLGIYFVGFLSAVFMSAGMSLIIFITAMLSVTIRKSTNQNSKLSKILEYGSLLFILSLGVVLLIVS